MKYIDSLLQYLPYLLISPLKLVFYKVHKCMMENNTYSRVSKWKDYRIRCRYLIQISESCVNVLRQTLRKSITTLKINLIIYSYYIRDLSRFKSGSIQRQNNHHFHVWFANSEFQIGILVHLRVIAFLAVEACKHFVGGTFSKNHHIVKLGLFRYMGYSLPLG